MGLLHKGIDCLLSHGYGSPRKYGGLKKDMFHGLASMAPNRPFSRRTHDFITG